MAFDPSTLCARTLAGDSELAAASLGLSLGQRRVLALLQNPVAADELGRQLRLEPEKLARDLTRLADLRLVELQRPGIVPERSPASLPVQPTATNAASMAPVVIGRSTRRSPALPLTAGVAAIVLATGIWYGTRANPDPAQKPAPTATAPVPAAPVPVAAAPLPQPPAITAAKAGDAATSSPTPSPVTALALRQATAPVVPRPQSRAEVAAPAVPSPAPAPIAPPPSSMQRPDTAGKASPATTATTATAPLAAAPSALAPPVAAPSAPAPSPAPAAAADAPPPIQLAAAAPTLAGPRPAAGAGLKAISREPPDFPKEAIADGHRSGVVNARIHVDARGNVTGVDILGSQPPKVFDRAVRRALLRWQFEPNAAGQSADLDVDVKFQRD